MSDSYDDYEAKIQLQEHAWEKRVVKTEHDKQIELAQAYERGWNAALAQQEPVAWISDSPTNGKLLHWTKAEAWRWSSNITPLYTAPVDAVNTSQERVDETAERKHMTDLARVGEVGVWGEREWVGLTDEEIGEVISGQFAERNYWVKITKALEAKLKEKNT
jgi:hypothetical protein